MSGWETLSLARPDPWGRIEVPGQTETYFTQSGAPAKLKTSLRAMSENQSYVVPRVTRLRLVEEITDRLREMIVTGDLRPGTRLLQTELANSLGVSRTPLREAFRILENDGMIRTSNGNRTVEVVSLGADELKEMLEIREVIDGLAARLTARAGLTKETEKELRILLRQMKASMRPFNPSARIEAHAAFHSLIAESSNNKALQTFLPLIRVSSAALYMPYIEDPSLVQEGGIEFARSMEYAQEGHQDIFAALLAGDGRKAETAARKHIAKTLSQVDHLNDLRRAITDAREATEGHPHTPQKAQSKIEPTEDQ